jgi:cephalosporin hydroxylase
MKEQELIDAFHRLYYDRHRCFQKLSFLGVHTVKYPTDLLVYAEILWECRPTVIVECGTHAGGSALFLATILDAIGAGRIVTIDTNDLRPTQHPRIVYLRGSTVAPDVQQAVRNLTFRDNPIFTDKLMVILDSAHSRGHVLSELAAYAPLVTPGQYLIVEDTNVNGHPVFAEHGPGPMEAVREFLQTDLGDCFSVDKSREKFLLTANPGGYLKRLK